MKINFLNKIDKWLEKIMNYPGADKYTVTQQKIYWISSLAVSSMIFCLTIVYHFVFPQLKIIIYYGILLTAIYLQGVIIPLFRHKVAVWHMFLNSAIVTVISFVCILLLGGIPNSGGLIFVGLAIVFFTLNYKKKSHTFGIFIIYAITVVLAGFLQPYLTVPAEMTQEVNISLFVINLLWISGFAMVFVLSFISQRIKLEQVETNRIKEIDDAKTRLYTNITHEFRTPLTIILGMVDLIREKPEKWTEEGLNKIENNSKILIHLVSQMLDLSKLEAGVMSLNMISDDIVPYIRYLTDLFNSIAESKKIRINYSPVPDKFVMDYDPDKIMEIISNLISNALKYTQTGGEVEIRTEVTEDEGQKFRIFVRDNGPGISAENLPYIFDRFFRIESPVNSVSGGSGLGLALTKELAKLLDGTISVNSAVGKGTEFVVTLPVTNKAPFIAAKSVEKERIPVFFSSNDKINSTTEKAVGKKPFLLIVEDSNDVIKYLEELLEPFYNIRSATNGREGWEVALEFIPDIILSDIMMPEMDGIELLDKVKNDFRTSHIPVVMLTAKADIASRLEGLRKGADAYISKPFNREELILQLERLIVIREKLHERYSRVSLSPGNGDKEYEMEDNFMRNIRNIIAENISSEDFNIQILCRMLSMSRTQLYRKFRSLTSQTINKYLRSIRLGKAKELLLTKKFNVSESAYMTGFKNISHFSKVFKDEFGINPREINK